MFPVMFIVSAVLFVVESRHRAPHGRGLRSRQQTPHRPEEQQHQAYCPHTVVLILLLIDSQGKGPYRGSISYIVHLGGLQLLMVRPQISSWWP